MEPYFNNLQLFEKEISLEDIFVLHAEGFYENADLNAKLIYDIIKDLNSTWSTGQYYLFGNTKIDPDTKITTELIKLAETIDENRYKEYGDPCNSFEAASIQRTHNNFKDLCEIIHYTKTKFKAKVD